MVQTLWQTNAQQYAKDNNLKSCTDNEADAYRHFSWNYDCVKDNIPIEDVSEFTTNHEVLTQEYFGKDKNGVKYYKVALSSLMDLTNNKIGRYQATLPHNKGKDSEEVFNELLKSNAVVTSLEQVKKVWKIKDEWLYEGEEGVRGEVSVVIKGSLKEDALSIKVVDGKAVKIK